MKAKPFVMHYEKGRLVGAGISIKLIPGSLRSCILTSSLAKIAFFCFNGFKRETHFGLIGCTLWAF